MDDLAAAVARAVALTATTRLVSIDAAGLIDAGDRDVYAAFGRSGGSRRVVADPLRLPLVASIADAVVARYALGEEPPRRWRETWRVLAPAGRAVFVIDLPASRSVISLIRRAFARRRIARQLDAAMFAIDSWQRVGTALVVRASKRDGLAGARRRTATALAPAAA